VSLVICRQGRQLVLLLLSVVVVAGEAAEEAAVTNLDTDANVAVIGGRGKGQTEDEALQSDHDCVGQAAVNAVFAAAMVVIAVSRLC
jgi:hypothetical protein